MITRVSVEVNFDSIGGVTDNAITLVNSKCWLPTHRLLQKLLTHFSRLHRMALQGGKAESQGKRNVKVSKCQRPKRSSALEPVLEHCELASMYYTSPKQCSQAAQKGISLRILSKLRDGYVKLMNDVASGVDLTGASSYYGATGPGDCPASAMMLNSSRRPSAVAN